MADPSNYSSVIVSESLQKKFRDSFPAQSGQGLGGDLLASGVIVPIVDFSSQVESGGLSQQLQEAICFGSATTFDVSNGTSTLVNTPGFYRVTGYMSNQGNGNTDFARLNLTDGATTKIIVNQEVKHNATTNDAIIFMQFDLIIFLASGESLTASASNAFAIVTGSLRQVATSDGTLVNPSGFSSG